MRFDSFFSLLDYWTQLQPDHPAFIFERDGKQILSYHAFRERVQEKAAMLRDCGYHSIGVLCDGQIDCVIALFACTAAKVQAVLLDPALPSDLREEQMLYTDVDCLLDTTGALCPVERLHIPVAPAGQRFLFFTSGTTDEARAVMLTEKNLCSSAFNGASMLPLKQDDLLMCLLPLNHVFGFVCGMLWGLHCGATVALGRGLRFLGADCAYFRPSAVSLVPAMLDLLLHKELLNEELKTVLVGAGPCPADLIVKAQSKGLHVSFGYGLTETSSGVAISVEDDPFALSACPDDVISIAEDGEILITSPTCMMQGYYKDRQMTEEVLRCGVLSTGDIGYLDAQGKLHITGRKKDVLVLPNGTKLFLPEYERRISAVIPYKDFAVVWKNEKIVLVISGEAYDKNELFQALDSVLSRYNPGQQIQDIQFQKQPLPRTLTGKLMRWKL